jgi:nitrite reductase/ring-hydroxylating ferredoxin subunit
MPVGELVTVASAAELPPGSLQPVRVGDAEVALANVDGEFHALQPACPHLGGPLGHGRLDGCVLTCPWHGWQFDVTTGENEFDRAITIERYDVVVEDGQVKVALPG